MREVQYSDIRTSQYVLVEQVIPTDGPRLGGKYWYAGKVSEVSAKWLLLKEGRIIKIAAQQGQETFYVLDKKEYNKYIKDFDLETAS